MEEMPKAPLLDEPSNPEVMPDNSPKTSKSTKKLPVTIAISAALIVVIAGGAIAFKKTRKDGPGTATAMATPTPAPVTAAANGALPATQQYQVNLADTDSLDPVTKGKSLTYGKCDGQGATTLTHAPMDPKDIGSIAPEGGFGGAHVTPIDHEYYYGLDINAPADTYPVYAVMDGNLNAVGNVMGAKTSWNITLSHSCTFMAYYNLMTSLAPNILSQLPANWQQISGNVKIPVKAGDVIGYSGGQSLDFQLANTETTLKGLLNHNAYNFAEPIKINGVRPLDYFADDVKTAILPKYLRQAEPRDGTYAYDVEGQAVGNWFAVGTNGYGGTAQATDEFSRSAGHLSLAYDSFNPSSLVFSTGNYQGKPQVFAVKGAVDWTKITPGSGIAKVELAEGGLQTSTGAVWNGGYVSGGLTFVAKQTLATALVEMTDKDHLKVELFPGKTPAQVTAFTAAATTYDRGQDAKSTK